MEENVLSQLVGWNELARAEDTVDPPAHLVLFRPGLFHIRYDSDRALVHLAVFIKSLWMLIFDVSNDMVPVDEVLKIKMMLVHEHETIIIGQSQQI